MRRFYYRSQQSANAKQNRTTHKDGWGMWQTQDQDHLIEMNQMQIGLKNLPSSVAMAVLTVRTKEKERSGPPQIEIGSEDLLLGEMSRVSCQF